MNKNSFEIIGNVLMITREEWNFVASVTVRPDYVDEIMSVTWGLNNDYLYNKKLGYLHIYIIKKWYGENEYLKMKDSGFVVDHMDNDISNCRIENLCFLTCDENKAKGFTVDKLSKEKTHIALTLYKDFSTSLFQIAIAFNYPAKGKIMELNNEKQLIDLVYLLYDSEYEIVLNDARKILYDYKRDYTFELEKLCCADYHIEGCYGEQPSLEAYDKYIEGNHNSMIVYIVKEPIRENWTLEIKEKSIIFR